MKNSNWLIISPAVLVIVMIFMVLISFEPDVTADSTALAAKPPVGRYQMRVVTLESGQYYGVWVYRLDTVTGEIVRNYERASSPNTIIMKAK